MSRRTTRTATVEATLYVMVEDEHEVPIVAKATVSPYDPGRVIGPPEQCYPPEGGEVSFISVVAGECIELSPVSVAALFGDDVLERLELACFEEAQGQSDD